MFYFPGCGSERLFSQVGLATQAMLYHLGAQTVLVSCGTCLDQLEQYQFDRIFPGCRVMDIHEYLMEKGVKLDGTASGRYLLP